MHRPPPVHSAADEFENRHAEKKHSAAMASHRAKSPAFTCTSACTSKSPGKNASAKPHSISVTSAARPASTATITPIIVHAMRVRLFGVASR